MGANAGLLFKYNDKLSVGFSAQSGVKIKMDGMANLTAIFPRNDGLRDQDTTYSVYYQGGFSGDETTFEMDMDMPASFGIGIAFRPEPEWLLTLDASATQWSKVDGWAFTYEDPLDLRIKEIDPLSGYELPFDLGDTWKFAFGVQHQPTENLFIRGGYFFDQSATPDETLRPYLPDYNDRHGLNFGASYILNKIEFAGQLNSTFTSARSVEELYDINGDGQFDSFPGDYNTSQVEVLISTIYRF
jgi:long-chain fatty acid transport protein